MSVMKLASARSWASNLLSCKRFVHQNVLLIALPYRLCLQFCEGAACRHTECLGSQYKLGRKE